MEERYYYTNSLTLRSITKMWSFWLVPAERSSDELVQNLKSIHGTQIPDSWGLLKTIFLFNRTLINAD